MRDKAYNAVDEAVAYSDLSLAKPAKDSHTS